MKLRTIVIFVLLILLLAVSTFSVYRYLKPTEQPQTSNSQPNTQTNTEPKLQTYPVSVYFSKHPDSDDDPSKVYAVSRTSPDLGSGKFVMSELLKGPSTTEKDQGYFTTVRVREGDSNCSDQNFTLSIENTVATLKFCRTFDHLGVISDGQAESAIKASLNQFDSVDKVVVLNKEGNCEFDLSGMNLCKQ